MKKSFDDFLKESTILMESVSAKDIITKFNGLAKLINTAQLSGTDVRTIENILSDIQDNLDGMINEDKLVEDWITTSGGQHLWKDDDGNFGGSTDAISKMGVNKKSSHKGKWDASNKKVDTDTGHRYWKSSKETKDDFIKKVKTKHKEKTGKDLSIEGHD